jgi:pSer/pThr/pTyr-binding forkhead associated (FHA) protein
MTKDDGPRHDGERTDPDVGAHVAGGPRVPHLIVLAGPKVGDVYPLREGTLIIGRADDADIHLLDLTISRHHAQLTVLGEDVTVSDLNSRNGTGLGIRRLKGSHLLKDGEVLQVGGVTLLKVSSVRPPARRERDTTNDLVHFGIHSPNRHYLRDQLRLECAYARRHRSPLSLVFIQPNAILGAYTDGVMGRVAAAIHELSRREDTLIRFARNRFVILLRETSSSGKAMATRVAAELALRTVAMGDGTKPSMALFAVVVGLTRGTLEHPEAAFEAAGLKADSRSGRAGAVEAMELLKDDL